MNVALDYKADTHEYFIKGVRVPSVTQVLRPLYAWHEFVHPDVLARKALIGTYVDEAIGLDLGPGVDPDSIDPSIRGYFDAWLAFRNDSKYQHIAYQERVAHERYSYAGTLDLRGYVNDWKAIVDVKCVAQLSPAVALQTVGYCGTFPEPHKRFALRLAENGKYQLVEYTEREDWSVFLGLLNAHRWKERHGLN